MKLHFNKSLLSGQLLFFCLAGSGFLSVWLGQDANWDLKNYHIYNPWALLHNRSDIDLFAAGIQTYFNPILDLPYYFLAVDLLGSMPRTVAFMMGLPYGLLIFFLFKSAHLVLVDLQVTTRYQNMVATLLVAFGVSGAATAPQIGTTFNEIQVAAIIIAGVMVLLSGLRGIEQPFNLRTAFWGGMLFGLAAGLKLTAGIYAPAAAIALFFAIEQKRKAIFAMAIFSMAWALGFGIMYGWWAFHLYVSTGNPMFPMFENVFHTTWMGAGVGMDNRFKPHTLSQAVLYPFFWIGSTTVTVAEPIFSDPRFAVALASFLVLTSVLLLARSGQRVYPLDNVAHLKIPKTSLFILVFTAVAYVVWLSMFSILRYAVSIEALLGLSIGINLIICTRYLHIKISEKILVIFLCFLLLGVSANTKYPQWGRTNYGDSVLRIQPVALEPDSLIIVLGSPQAYVLPDLAKQTRNVQFVGITDDLLSARKFDLWKKVSQKIDLFSGVMYAMVLTDATHRLRLLPEIGLSVDEKSCQLFATNIDSSFSICRLYRHGN